MDNSFRSLPCEIDMDDIPGHHTIERVLGQQYEMLEAFSAEAFQARLRECESKHDRSSAAFRRERLQLAMEVHASIIPKYGFKGTLNGVVDMLQVAKEPSSPSFLKELRSGMPKPREDAWHQYLQWQELPQSRPPAQEELKQQKRRPMDRLSYKGAPVEIDMDDVAVAVPMDRQRALAMQKELYAGFGAPRFQAQLRESERRHAGRPGEALREHQQLVMGVQAHVLPKYGFKPTLEGVLDMLAAAQGFADDPEVSDNMAVINDLISMKGRARPAPRQGGA